MSSQLAGSAWMKNSRGKAITTATAVTTMTTVAPTSSRKYKQQDVSKRKQRQPTAACNIKGSDYNNEKHPTRRKFTLPDIITNTSSKEPTITSTTYTTALLAAQTPPKIA